MTQYKAINSAVEVNGQTVFSVVDGMGVAKEMAIRVLEDNNIQNPKEGEWYLQQEWLNAFKQIAEKIGHNTLFSIGKKIPENADFPPEINSIEKALAAIDVAYHMNHRLEGKLMFDPATGTMIEGIGHYGFKKVGVNKIDMKCDNPYPCDFDRGIIEAMARRFRPDNAIFVDVDHDENEECRQKGGQSCTYHVTW